MRAEQQLKWAGPLGLIAFFMVGFTVEVVPAVQTWAWGIALIAGFGTYG
jgi:hypothetical protein